MPKAKAQTNKSKSKKKRHVYDKRRGIVISERIQAADLFEGCALTEDERDALGLSHMSHDGKL